MPSCCNFCRAVCGLPDFQAMTRSGFSSMIRSRSIRNASPTRGICATCAGKLLYSTTALSCSPAPAANTISARLGARVIMRAAGLGRVRISPSACNKLISALDGCAVPRPKKTARVNKVRLISTRTGRLLMRSRSPAIVLQVRWPRRPESARPGPWTA